MLFCFCWHFVQREIIVSMKCRWLRVNKGILRETLLKLVHRKPVETLAIDSLCENIYIASSHSFDTDAIVYCNSIFQSTGDSRFYTIVAAIEYTLYLSCHDHRSVLFRTNQISHTQHFVMPMIVLRIYASKILWGVRIYIGGVLGQKALRNHPWKSHLEIMSHITVARQQSNKS